MTPDERETIVRSSDGDDVVRIWTAQRTVITRLTKDDRFELVSSGQQGGRVVWAEFTIPADKYSPVTGAKKRFNLSETEKQKRAERAAAMRAARKS